MFSSINTPQGTSLRIAKEADIEEIAEFDALVFGQHHGITVQELQDILKHGAVIILVDDFSGEIIGESQVLTEHVDWNPYRIASNEAFYYGTAIQKVSQGSGIGRILAAAQDCYARSVGKSKIAFTVRVENYPSIKLRLSTGSRVTDYLPYFYGTPESGGARLLMTKSLETSAPEPVKVVQIVHVRFGDVPDLAAHRTIAALCGHGYQGCAVAVDSKTSLGHIVFKR